jgi:hypothetical protein
MNQGCFTFCQKLFRSNDHFSEKKHSVKWPFFDKSIWSNELSVKWQFFGKSFQSNDHFSKKDFGQMSYYVISVIWLVCQVRFSVWFREWPFSKYDRSNDLLINFVCGQMTFFGKMNFRSNGLRLNGDSVKCTFGQMAFGQTAFGQMVFRSNGLSVKNFRWNDFSVKWSRTRSVIIKGTAMSINWKDYGKCLHADWAYQWNCRIEFEK